MYIVKKILFSCICLFLLYQFTSRATDRFSIRKIQATLPHRLDWETEEKILPHDQSFFYLGHGAQTYVFISSDGKYVLKFYRHNRATHPLAFLAPILPFPIKKSLLTAMEKRKEKREKDFSSFMLAYHNLEKETGLVYLHLNPTKKAINVKLFDKIGVQHILDLSQMSFILQKRAKPIYESLEKWITFKEWAQAQQALSQLIALLKTRCQKGIFDKDPDLKTNFGFTEEGPIQFDMGRFKKDPTRKNPEIYRNDLIRITDLLCQWLDEKAPDLARYVKEEINRT